LTLFQLVGRDFDRLYCREIVQTANLHFLEFPQEATNFKEVWQVSH